MENIKYITRKDLERIYNNADSVKENIPAGHCRIREENYNRAIIDNIMAAKGRTEGKTIYIVVTYTENLGNKRYPHNIRKVDIVRVGKSTKETPKTYAGYRKSNILAMVK